MKSSKFVLGGLLALSAGLLAGCSMTGAGNVRVHEATLYGGTQERIVWVYGTLGSSTQSSLKLGGTAVTLQAQVGQDPLALPGTLSVNGKATYRVATTPGSIKVNVTRDVSGRFSVQPEGGAALSAVYFTDGTRWQKLSTTNGVATGVSVNGLTGAGALTSEEGVALGQALLGQGPLAVAVLNEQSVADPALTVEPAPQESLRTALYVLPGVRTVAGTGTTGTVTTTPSTGSTAGRVGFVEIASGNNASASAGAVQVATTQAALGTLYATAYGRQTGIPAAPRLNAGETAVGIFIGQRNTGGYSVRVTNASAQDGVLTLTVALTVPGSGSITTQAITSPWTLVRLSGSYSQVRVVDTSGRPLQLGQ
ncbi:protease complex subunit PrcB family protein [Deinococcus aquatilis]|uniref:protease complex subunit PrcB family protein n=1 Tax=Deinococcus aquatilis TaxID=519440 RepID=UPI000370E1F3|nr:protease complex subunit PrcB family protein [Deinococcus aquatilis]